MSRQEFSKPNKTLLASRVGYHCSNPACGVATIGPSENPANKEYIGVAAHIYSASIEKGPRANPNLTEQERRSLNNGIHLCSKCSTMIDKNNGEDYPPVVLFNWKRCAEAAAKERTYQSRPISIFTKVDFSNLEQQYSTALTCTGLNEKNILSCPSDQNVVLEIINKLNLANKCILAGSSGSGKSLLTYQTAYNFHQRGWKVFKINKESISSSTVLAAPTAKSMIIIDDAQTIETHQLENLLGSAYADCVVLANWNTSTLPGDDIIKKFPEVQIVCSSQIQMLKQFCLDNKQEIAETLRSVGLNVKSNDFHSCIESRIERAACETTPWQFNYRLTEGWNAAKSDFNLLRDEEALHVVLLTVAAFQYATLDLGVSEHIIINALRKYKNEDEWLDKARKAISNKCLTHEGKIRNKHYEYSRKIFSIFVSGGGSQQEYDYLIALLKDILTSAVYERGHSNIIEFVMFDFKPCKYQLNNDGFTQKLAEDLVFDDTNLTPAKINKMNSLIRINSDVISVLKYRDNLVENWVLTCSKDNAYQLANFINTLFNEKFRPLESGNSLFDHLLSLIISADLEERPRYSHLINRMYLLLSNDDRRYASEKLGASEFSVNIPRFRTEMACRHFSNVVKDFYVINQSWADKQIADNIESIANLFNNDFANSLEDFNELLNHYFGIIYAILGNYNPPPTVKKHGRELTRRIEESAILDSSKNLNALQIQRYSNIMILFSLYNQRKLNVISDKFDYAILESLFSDLPKVDHYHRALISILRNPESPNWRRHASWVIQSVNYVEKIFFGWDPELALQRLRDGVKYQMRIHMCSDCKTELIILKEIYKKESKKLFWRIVQENTDTLTKEICAKSQNSDDHRSKFDLLLFLVSYSEFIIRDIFGKDETCKDVVDKLERLLRGKKWEKLIGMLYIFLMKKYGAANQEQILAIEKRFSSVRDFDIKKYVA